MAGISWTAETDLVLGFALTHSKAQQLFTNRTRLVARTSAVAAVIGISALGAGIASAAAHASPPPAQTASAVGGQNKITVTLGQPDTCTVDALQNGSIQDTSLDGALGPVTEYTLDGLDGLSPGKYDVHVVCGDSSDVTTFDKTIYGVVVTGTESSTGAWPGDPDDSTSPDDLGLLGDLFGIPSDGVAGANGM
jgi:hypothetical protein